MAGRIARTSLLPPPTGWKEGSAITASPIDQTEQRLRAALGARASRVRPPTLTYRQVSQTWRRRERKRRLILAILATLIFTAADAIGLWALNQANPESHIVFSDPTSGHTAITRVGQP
jgi:hypothetical protein